MTKTVKAAVVAMLACVAATLAAQEASVPETVKLQRMAARFAPTDITADLSKLSATDRHVLAKLVEASKIIDALFLRQVWVGQRGDAARSRAAIRRPRDARGCTTS